MQHKGPHNMSTGTVQSCSCVSTRSPFPATPQAAARPCRAPWRLCLARCTGGFFSPLGVFHLKGGLYHPIWVWP